MINLYLCKCDENTQFFKIKKHVDPIRTTPKPYRYKPIAKFVPNPNKQLANVMALIEPMEKFKVNSNK